LDNAKYPLRQIEEDSFVNIRNQSVVFGRGKDGRVVNYRTGGRNFKLLSREFKKVEMFPRRDLFHNPESYTYVMPEQKNDGLATGDLIEEIRDTEPIIKMVKETIKGKFPEVHNILVLKNDKLIFEEYFYGYDADTPHQLRSSSKPLIEGILGIAIDKGFIKDEKEKLIPFFAKEYQNLQNMDERKKLR